MSNSPSKETQITLSATLVEKMAVAAKAAYPKETGGLLLGWWEGNEISIQDLVEVLDPNASRTSWTRYENSSQESLNDTLDNHPKENIGYIGDWHSHPEICTASSTDIQSLIRASKQYSHPLTLIIVLPDKQIDLHVAVQGKICPTNIVFRENIKGVL